MWLRPPPHKWGHPLRAFQAMTMWRLKASLQNRDCWPHATTRHPTLGELAPGAEEQKRLDVRSEGSAALHSAAVCLWGGA